MPRADDDGGAVQRIACELEKLAVRMREAAVADAAASDNVLGQRSPREPEWRNQSEWARRIYLARRTRDQLFGPDMFADPRWDMMLDLYLAHHEQRRISVSSACIASAVPSTTALRHLQEMVDRGWIGRHACEHDARRVYVFLTPDAVTRMDVLFNRLNGSPDTSPGSARKPS